ncbi:hypothetical protein [Flavobacterium psychrophilum]|uniref:Uncharacterized protein n=1 Tax=Flavobacterium psychrophilum TaxID=96345 RepID=A0A7U2R9P8_FLAPS|nr:hypothetical protein [Flavobacterium psychrophilum]QRE03469.1 hypothetical protein H0H26_11350 [Flavobacterium psychrophilum]
MITTLQYNYGFEYKNVRYVWKSKKLFRLPYVKNNRSYSFLEIPAYCPKTTIVYNIQKDKLTQNRLKSITKKVEHERENNKFSRNFSYNISVFFNSKIILLYKNINLITPKK